MLSTPVRRPRRCAEFRRHFVHHEIFKGRNQERAQFAFLAVGGVQPSFFKKTAEEFLGQVLGIRRGLPATPGIGIQRKPVGMTEGFQSCCRFRRILPRGRQYQRDQRVCGNIRGASLDEVWLPISISGVNIRCVCSVKITRKPGGCYTPFPTPNSKLAIIGISAILPLA